MFLLQTRPAKGIRRKRKVDGAAGDDSSASSSASTTKKVRLPPPSPSNDNRDRENQYADHQQRLEDANLALELLNDDGTAGDGDGLMSRRLRYTMSRIMDRQIFTCDTLQQVLTALDDQKRQLEVSY